jgi:UDP-GlcNAc:undecaprenyl-phosphate GlcNAc-1-phosphate transferase
MGLPLIDAAWQIFRRLMLGRNPIYGDRGHLHFRLVDMGYSPRLIVIGYYVFCSLFGAIALITASRLFKLIALIIMGLLLAGTFIFISYHQSHTASRNSLSDESSSS